MHARFITCQLMTLVTSNDPGWPRVRIVDVGWCQMSINFAESDSLISRSAMVNKINEIQGCVSQTWNCILGSWTHRVSLFSVKPHPQNPQISANKIKRQRLRLQHSISNHHLQTSTVYMYFSKLLLTPNNDTVAGCYYWIVNLDHITTVTDRIIEKNKMVKCPGATRATPKCLKKKKWCLKLPGYFSPG